MFMPTLDDQVLSKIATKSAELVRCSQELVEAQKVAVAAAERLKMDGSEAAASANSFALWTYHDAKARYVAARTCLVRDFDFWKAQSEPRTL